MPESLVPEDWDEVDEAGGSTEEFKYIELEFLFDSAPEATHISEVIASIVDEFDTKIVDADVVWDKDDPSARGDGGIALYDVFPNRPGLFQALQDRLTDFNVDITIWPTSGM